MFIVFSYSIPSMISNEIAKDAKVLKAEIHSKARVILIFKLFFSMAFSNSPLIYVLFVVI